MTNPTRVKRLERAVALRWSIVASLIATVVLAAFLTVQMALGADPALGPDTSREASTPQVEPVATQTAPSDTAPAPEPVQTTTS